MPFVISFDQPESALASLVGGKGANLVALTAGGFPVPPGFVVTAEAYRTFMANVADLAKDLDAFDYANPDRLREQCIRLRERLLKTPLPTDLEAAIRKALGRFESGAAFAVRSSSTFEDLAQAAFAGQHDTYLNVIGIADILARVRDCFISLWQDRAVLYRHHQGFSQTEAQMAVVVQRQVACDRAGVGFSIDPVTGRLDRLVLDANYGLGESVVSGEVEVDHLELDKATLAVIGQTIGRKTKMVAAIANGTEERHVPADQANTPCLSDAQVRAVAELLKKVESHYGWPQDIEWGWRGEALYLFQARPVTTILPRWTRDESAERFPRPMTPLSWDFLSVAFRKSMKHSFELMGLPPLQGDWFGWFDHYVYGNQNAVALVASFRPLRARSPQELAAEIPVLRRRFGWVLELPVWWARDLDRYLIQLGRLQTAPLGKATIPQLIDHINHALDVATEYFMPNIAISMTQAFLHRLLHGLVAMAVGPEKALPIVDGLLAGCETKTAVVNRELHELAQLAAKHHPALAEALVELGGAKVLEQGKVQDFPEFAARFSRFLDDHGHREMDMDYYHPTWSEQPSIVLDSLPSSSAATAKTRTKPRGSSAFAIRRRSISFWHGCPRSCASSSARWFAWRVPTPRSTIWSIIKRRASTRSPAGRPWLSANVFTSAASLTSRRMCSSCARPTSTSCGRVIPTRTRRRCVRRRPKDERPTAPRTSGSQRGFWRKRLHPRRAATMFCAACPAARVA